MKFILSSLGVLFSLLAFAAICGQAKASAMPRVEQNFRNVSANCTDVNCVTPDCRCSSVEIPDELESADIPQFVLISFDNAVTVSNYPLYEEFSTLTNPNGCPIKMTFFVSHENTNYSLVNQLHTLGHELASHSVSLTPDIDNYWHVLTEEQWTEEIVGAKNLMRDYGLIPEEDIIGFRAPYLEVGGDVMYQALQNSNFEYDCSWPTLLYTTWYQSFGNDPLGVLWPYTLDYLSIQEETVGTKPTDSFPGFWVNPMTDLRDRRGEACSMLDLCLGVDDELETSAQAVYDMLVDNFDGHYYGSKAPFGLYTRESWFRMNDDNSTAHEDGFRMFLEYLTSYPDVYIVSVKDVFDWVRNPVLSEDMDDFENVQCNSALPPSECTNNWDCHYDENLPIDRQEIYMNICGTVADCPPEYPWVGNELGRRSQKPKTP